LRLGSRGMNPAVLLLRDWRGGELGVLLSALLLAVSVVVGISAFVNSLQSALVSESLRFLAADRVIRSGQAIPSEWTARAELEGLKVAQTLGFPSMAVTESDNLYLASIMAVSSSYPLRGELLSSETPYGEVRSDVGVPKPGEAWLAPRLFALLEVKPGDRVWVGDKALVISGAVRGQPDTASAAFGYGPRLLMNLADIPATGVIQPGSRVTWRLLLAGEVNVLDTFTQWVTPLLGQGQRLLGVEDSQPSISRTLDRAQGFLLLAGSLGVVLAAAAIALAARRFSERHTDHVAIMKSLGASRGRIARLYGGSLLMLGAFATALGCALGWALQGLFFKLFTEQLGVQPGPIGLEPYLIGGATALVCLGFFAWPPLQRLAQIPPLRVLRRDIDAGGAQRWVDYALGAISVFGLMWWYSGDLRVTGSVVAGLSLTVGAGYCAAQFLLRGGRVLGSAAGSFWRLALANLQRRGAANALQMVVFAIAIMLMLVLVIVRGALIDQWQAQLPPGSPNHFMLNITADERASLASFLSERDIKSQPQFPMTRGRVMAVNGEKLAAADSAQSQRRQREANFTYADTLPEANKIIAGEWWDADTDEAQVSLEEEFAQRVGATVGDVLELRIASESFEARVSSLRESDWQSMKPNFFVIFPKKTLERFPKTFLTSFYLPVEQKAQLNALITAFPTVTIIELDIVIAEIRTIIDRVGQAIELVLGVILLAGALVLIAGVQASVDIRLRESALLRALGAKKSLLLGALLIEFSTLGAFAGLLAVLGAEMAAWALQTQALDLTYQASPWLWPWSILAGVILIGGLGVLSCRKAVVVPPLVVLREL
jgi:putative ABC transport system permease protein